MLTLIGLAATLYIGYLAWVYYRRHKAAVDAAVKSVRDN